MPSNYTLERTLGAKSGMSPTIFRDGSFRFYFFSREEPRMHIHVGSPDGEAKFWIEPTIEMAESYGIPTRELTNIREMVESHEQVIRAAWRRHFGR